MNGPSEEMKAAVAGAVGAVLHMYETIKADVASAHNEAVKHWPTIAVVATAEDVKARWLAMAAEARQLAEACDPGKLPDEVVMSMPLESERKTRATQVRERLTRRAEALEWMAARLQPSASFVLNDRECGQLWTPLPALPSLLLFGAAIPVGDH